jgi:alpha-tubulin suppressor-like RCC1 family protein
MNLRDTSASALVLLALAGCHESPTSHIPVEPTTPAAGLAELRCEADVAAGVVDCVGVDAAATGGASRNLVTVGGQHHYVRLSSGATSHDAVTGIFSTTVTVQNLLMAPMGTADGVTPHANGVRVFLASGPTNGVIVENASGQAMFLSGSHDYFQYSGFDLGVDAVLAPDETSAGRGWRFATGGAASFGFTVYVQAEIPAGVAATAHFTKVSAGETHTCALTAGGAAYCWGSDGNGRLGNGPAIASQQGVPSRVAAPAGVTFTDIAAGGYHTCAIASGGTAYCWGSDSWGQLGDGPGGSSTHPSPVAVQMPAAVTFSRIHAGQAHSCALGSDLVTYCWGDNGSGRLGLGGGGPAVQHVPAPVVMPSGVHFTALSAGQTHTCALGSDDRAYCWGADAHGQLGNGAAVTGEQHAPSPVVMPTDVRFTAIAAGWTHSCAVTEGEQGYCWGFDGNGELGNGTVVTATQHAPTPVAMPTGVRFDGIGAGMSYTCARDTAGAAYCWGWNSLSQLGIGAGSSGDRHVPTAVVMPVGATFAGLAVGGHHACGTGSGPLFCWGYNVSRQVGNGMATNRPAPTVVAATR